MIRILVADDESEIRTLVVKILRSRGYRTIEATNGADALDLAIKYHPDLVLSDVMMDCGSGFMLREMLLDEKKTASIPVILMTGRAQRTGAWRVDPEVEYLEKPFTVSQLMAAVDLKLAPKRRKPIVVVKGR